jgi:hypothetical protein
LLPEFEFTIDVPDEVIEQINIDDVRELIEAAGTGYNNASVIISNHSLSVGNLI